MQSYVLRFSCVLAALLAMNAVTTSDAQAAPPVPLSQFDLGPPPKPVVRLFWQDRETAQLKWGDVVKADGWQLAPAVVDQFPTLDTERQNLVQMKAIDQVLVVGVRDNQNGEFESGWVAVETGVVGESHGDHMDWKYKTAPEVIVSRLDTQQGNPAHLYDYSGAFYLANDALNGLTMIRPQDLRKNPKQAGRFFAGGGNHITMAAVNNRICYSTWIDGGGPNMGRVDVVNLRSKNSDAIRYSFALPTGVIHGATANSGRVFFAPADGICWVDADLSLKQNADSVQIHHIDLGKDPETDKPHRTGSFTNFRNIVLFQTGAGASATLCVLNAKDNPPEVIQIPIDVADGLSLTPPRAIFTSSGKRYAFLFQDRKEGEGEEFLTVIDLDPDGNRTLADAKVVKTISVGASSVKGHYGHHAIVFDEDGRWAFWTNPGDGTISMLSLADLKVVSTFEVDGAPDHLTAVGAENPH